MNIFFIILAQEKTPFQLSEYLRSDGALKSIGKKILRWKIIIGLKKKKDKKKWNENKSNRSDIPIKRKEVLIWEMFLEPRRIGGAGYFSKDLKGGDLRAQM
jgi:hypothetical protein